jgi:peptide/nickel transport system substrate-binding protein
MRKKGREKKMYQMKMKKKLRLKLLTLGLVIIMIMSVFGGCGSSDDDENEGGSTVNATDTLTIGLPNEIGSLDSAFAYDFTTNPIVTNITEGLLIVDANNELLPNLASSWEEVDSLTYVYQIRDDVVFSDGTPLTVEDVIFSLERYRDPDLASYLAWMYDNVDTIEQTGDWEVTVKLTQADAFWQYVPSTTAGHISSKAAVEAGGDEYGTVNSFPIGSGPYPVESWAAGGDITLKYNEDYWDAENLGSPDVKTIVVQTIPEDSTRSLAAQTGQIDIDFSAPAELASEIEASESANLLTIPAPGFGFIAFNCQKAPFDDVNVRRAAASALDIPPLQDTIINGFGTPTNYLMVPEVLFIFEEEQWKGFEKDVPKYEFNLEKAKEYLSQSAYPDGFDCTFLIDEYTISGNIGLVVQQALKEIGINVTLDKQSNEEVVGAQFGEGIVDGVRPYDFGVFEWISDFPDPAGVLNPLLITSGGEEGGSNTAAYANEQVDQLLSDQLALTDTAERTNLLIEAQTIVQDEQPYVSLWQKNWLFTVSKRIQNAEDVLNTTYIWNFMAKNIDFE